jgi:hypothetical protein
LFTRQRRAHRPELTPATAADLDDEPISRLPGLICDSRFDGHLVYDASTGAPPPRLKARLRFAAIMAPSADVRASGHCATGVDLLAMLTA